MSEARNDVLILGASVIGLACAHYLLKAGRGVTVIDQGPHWRRASHGNCGTITPSHAPPLAMPGTVRKALRWMLRGDAPLYVRPRLDFELFAWFLRFAHRCNARDAARATAAGADPRRLAPPAGGIDQTEGWTASSSRRHLRLPRHARSKKTASTSVPGRGRASPAAPVRCRGEGARAGAARGCGGWPAAPGRRPPVAGSVRGGTGAARARAGRAHYRRLPCRGIPPRGGTRGRRGHGTGRDAGRRSGVGARAWSPLLAHQLDLRLPLQPGKGYSITYARPALCRARRWCCAERSVCVTARSSGYRLGSTMGFPATTTRSIACAWMRCGAARLNICLNRRAGPSGGVVRLAADVLRRRAGDRRAPRRQPHPRHGPRHARRVDGGGDRPSGERPAVRVRALV